MTETVPAYETSVFINCPFDAHYQPLFEAIVFCVSDCGFRARCALEVDDSAQVRIDKVFQIISECKYGSHDVSRTDLDPQTNLPRFNMPLELGIFLAAKRFGAGKQKWKVGLILDTERFRYHKFISDIAGQDIQSHHGTPRDAIMVVRNWLRTSTKIERIPDGTEIYRRYELFMQALPDLCRKVSLRGDELTYADFVTLVSVWLQRNSQVS